MISDADYKHNLEEYAIIAEWVTKQLQQLDSDDHGTS